MTGKGIKVAAQLLYVRFQMRCALCSVDNDDGSDTVSAGDYFFQRRFDTENVGNLRYGNYLRFCCDFGKNFRLGNMSFCICIHIF